MKIWTTIFSSLALVSAAFAVDWTAGTGDWNVGANWSGGAVPSGTTARIINGGTAQISADVPSTAGGNNTLRLVVGNSTAGGTVTQTAGNYNAGATHLGENGNNPGVYNLQGGTLTTGYLNIGNAGVGVFNHSGGTLLGSSWTGVATQGGGRGTYNISGTALYDRGNLEIAPRGGSDGVVNISGNADLRVNQVLFDHHAGAAARAELNLDGGNLSVNRIRIEDDAGGGASTFNWGSGTLRRKATITGAQGGFAVNGPGGEDPQRGATWDVYSNGNDALASLSTGSSINIGGGGSSVLDLGGFFINNGTRFGVLTLEGSLDLSNSNDTVMFGTGDNFLSPFGIGNTDWGSLTLIQAAQGITGEFNTFDFQGNILRRYNDTFTSASNLPINTFYTEYTANELIFHYRAGGTVPEPSTMTMVLVGFVFVRGLRRRYVKFMD